MYKENLNNEIAEYIQKNPDKSEFIIGKNIMHKGKLGKGEIKGINTSKEIFYITIKFNDCIKCFQLSSLGEWFEELILDGKISEEIKRQIEINKTLDKLRDLERTFWEKYKELDKSNEVLKNDLEIYKEKKLFMDECAKRNITSIYHFTNLENLEAILENGILSILELYHNKIIFKKSDENRFDNMYSYISTSIQFPNYRMFWGLRQKSVSSEWVVIELKPSIIWEKKCLFFYTNAASRRFKNGSVFEYDTVVHLEKLFVNLSYAYRADLNIPINYTTDPQAEVLVKDKIETCFIKNIYYNKFTENILNIIQKYGDKFDFKNNKSLFQQRKDYEFWQGKGGY